MLIVRVGAMGDVLHGLPAVAALRARMPGCFIGWAVEPRWKALLGEPVVDKVHEVPTREWKRRPFSVATVREVLRLRREMRAEEYEVCVDLQGSVRSAVIGRMAGAKRFVGAERPRERQARILYGERVELRAEHVVGQGCELVGAGAGEELQAVRVELPRDEGAERWAEAVVEELRLPPMSQNRDMGHPDGAGFVLLVPGGGWGAKQWGAERYRELARGLAQAGYRVLVNGVAGGEEIARDGHARVLESSVAELVALTRRAALVIGGDTGPVHLAAALGRPVVALFGPTDPRRNGPYFPGAKVRVLRDAGSVTEPQAGGGERRRGWRGLGWRRWWRQRWRC